MKTLNNRYDEGYSLVEMMLALVVGTVVLAGSFASYGLISQQYLRVSSISEVQGVGLPTLSMVVKDLRLAGRRAVDGNIEATFGAIGTPVQITDSNNACCDQLQVTYDVDLGTRYRKTYFALARQPKATSEIRNALYMDVELWDGAAWNVITDNALVADYLQDFQLVGTDISSKGFPTLIDVLLVFRSRGTVVDLSSYEKADYEIGNFVLEATDTFYRDEFSATVNLRNL
jgi:prepilin-type N-terminal cleavage/methylation domain-containing protein